MSLRLLSVPSSEISYIRRLNHSLRSRGVDVDEAPLPFIRWPRNLARFLAKAMVRTYDLWQLHWHLFDSRLVAQLSFARDVPKVWTVHNLVPHTRIFRDDLAITLLYLNQADVAVWHSERSLEDARHAIAARGFPASWRAENRVIPCMNYNGLWPDSVTESEARRRLGVNKDSFVVGHFAPTHPYKGTDVFLKAIRMVAREDILYCIFGECKDRTVERAIRNAEVGMPNLKVHLRPIPDDELQYWFKACNILVQPYTRLTTSASIYFPIAFRRPVVATPVGNVPDVILDGTTGWLARDPQGVARAIEEAARDPAATRAVGERAYNFVEKIANVDTVTDQYLAAYESAIRRHETDR